MKDCIEHKSGANGV